MEVHAPVASSSTISNSVLPLPPAGKSILKRPPQSQKSGGFSWSSLRNILPSNGSENLDEKPLKRAHFILPSLQTVYTFSIATPPSTTGLQEEKRNVEEREAERRRSVVRGNSFLQDKDGWWSMERVDSFYRECCHGREEPPNPLVSSVLLGGTIGKSSRTIDLSGIQLSTYSAAAFADTLTVEWGLRKLVLRDCGLEELSLKSILHALLIQNSISFLSIASNKKLKTPAWRFLGVFLSKTKTLEFLDISSNILEKKGVEYIVAFFEASPASQSPQSQVNRSVNGQSQTSPATQPHPVVSLRLDDCSLKPGALDVLAHAIRPSTLRNLSLRLNRFSSHNAVQLALIMKDYPDAITPGSTLQSPLQSPPGTPSQSFFPSTLPSPTPTSPITNGHLPLLRPPPRHPTASLPSPTTTYTPYIPKSKRAPSPASPQFEHNSIPLITSSPQGGVTTRYAGPSAALLDNIRALDNLPRLGALRTLDLRGNDLRNGVSYIAQVLKRNRTLKVLNLSENKIDMTGLLAVAEALKYNSCLETLDLGRNPCCGPGMDGVTSLRTAFTLNHSLKRLFLSGTSLSSPGAIALAEFLPESQSLIHLDLTNNPALDLAGIVALNAGLKKNNVMRCLDLDIPPGDEGLSRLCREILNSCIRNTELADERLRKEGGAPDMSGRGLGKGVWGMIEDSVIAKTFRAKDVQSSVDSKIQRARECVAKLDKLANSTTPLREEDGESAGTVLTQSKEAQVQLSEMIPNISNADLLSELLQLNDALTDKLQAVVSRKDFPQLVRKPSNRPASINVSGNGSVLGGGKGQETEEPEEDEDLMALLSPRVDKGKGRAEPEPEEVPVEPVSVLNPTFAVGGSDEEDGEEDQEQTARPRVLTMGGMPTVDDETLEGKTLGAPSPTERSRMWVEEEGEIFRKGQALLGQEELESEFAGEQLRIELLEAEVERPQPRQFDNNEEDDTVRELDQSLKTLASPVELARPPLPRSRSGSGSQAAVASPIVESPSPSPSTHQP